MDPSANSLTRVNVKELTNIKMDEYLKNNYQVTMDTVFDGKHEQDFIRVRRLYKK